MSQNGTAISTPGYELYDRVSIPGRNKLFLFVAIFTPTLALTESEVK